MTKEELLVELADIYNHSGDEESNHARADKALLDYIGDKDVSKLFKAIGKWYS